MTPSAPSSSPEAPSALLHWMLLAALFAIPLVVTVRPIGEPLLDPDIWWHLRVGQWVVEHQTVTSNDPFTQYGQQRPWVAYSWLYEVLLYGLFQAFGLAGIVLYRVLGALAVTAALYSLLCRLEPRLLPRLLLSGIALLAIAPLLSERPWLLTVLFSILTLHAIVLLREGVPARWLWALPLVYVLWANIHIQFIYGLFLLALALVAPWLDRQQGWRNPDDTAAWPGSTGYRRLLLLAVLCGLASLVNPYHVRIYLVVLDYASQPGPFRWVNELKAMEFRELPDWILLGLTGAACFVLGRRANSALPLLLLIGTAFFAFRSRRDVWFVLLADLLILSRLGLTFPLSLPAARPLPWLGRVGLLVFLGLLCGLLAWQRDLSPAGLERRVASKFPVAAAAHIAEQGYPGPLYNDFNWGGFVIWQLPQLPAAIDGRTNLHGDERIERFGRVWAGGTGWQDDPDLSAAGLILAPRGQPLTALLHFDSRFRLAYQDDLAVVFVRR